MQSMCRYGNLVSPSVTIGCMVLSCSDIYMYLAIKTTLEVSLNSYLGPSLLANSGQIVMIPFPKRIIPGEVQQFNLAIG